MQTCRSKSHPSSRDPRLQKKASTKIRTATTAPIAVKDASAGANTINEKKVPSVGANTINEKKGSSEGANTINGKKPPGVTSIDVFIKETLDDNEKNERKKEKEATNSFDNRTLQLLQRSVEINQGLMADKEELKNENAIIRRREAAALMDAAEERKKTAAEKAAKEETQAALNDQLKIVADLYKERTEYTRECSEKLQQMNVQLSGAIEQFDAEKKKLEAGHEKELSEINASMQPVHDENARLKTFTFNASSKIGELQTALDGANARVETLESELDLKNSSAGTLAAMIGAAIGGHANGAMLWRECHDAYNREYARLTYGCVAPQRKREHEDDDQELKIPPPSTSPSEVSCSSPHGDTENHGHKRRRNE